MRRRAAIHTSAVRPTAACRAAVVALALLGAASCGRYGPPTREAPWRGPEPGIEANRPDASNDARLDEGRDEGRSEQSSTADTTDMDDTGDTTNTREPQ